MDATLRSDGINNFDFAVFKRTGITESTNLEFRTEFFNLFNRTQFGFPGTSFNPVGNDNTANGFGVVSSSLGNPRLIQFALKFVF